MAVNQYFALKSIRISVYGMTLRRRDGVILISSRRRSPSLPSPISLYFPFPSTFSLGVLSFRVLRMSFPSRSPPTPSPPSVLAAEWRSEGSLVVLLMNCQTKVIVQCGRVCGAPTTISSWSWSNSSLNVLCS